MSRAQARVLFVEDSADDVELELAALRGAGLEVEHEIVDGPEELRAALAQKRWDVVISDFRLPLFSGLDALRIVREVDRDVGFILISGTVGEDLAVKAMRAGANDYVLKDNLTRMPAVVERELREGEARREKSRIEREQRFFVAAQQFLADVGRVLGRSLDAEDTLRESARLAVPTLADWATSYLLEGDRLRVIERTAADPTRQALASALPASYDVADGVAPAVQAVTTGAPLMRARLTDADLAAMAQDDVQLRAMRALGIRSIVVVPLRGRSELVGAIALAFAESGRTYTERELGVAEDFAARVGLAVENCRLLTAAQEGVRVRDEFLAMLGHELRNPLAPIVTSLELLKLRGEDTRRREFVVIERQTRYLTRLVDDLLDIARITRGKVSLECHPMELGVAVAKSIEAAAPLIEQRRHRLVVDVPASGLLVSGDEIRLTQVVTNLLTNAAKYTPEGGEVRVSAARDGEEVVLRVIDNGTGIPPELLPRLFDAFVQGARTIDRREGGLGLGLALVRNLVELHGGAVTASSAGPGRGSEFLVRLPVLAAAQPRANTAKGAPSVPPSALAGATRVLIVDDNPDAAETLSSLLAMLGCQVRVASSPREALSAASGFAPSVAVLDIGLPEMDGYELAARLRERLGSDLRLIAVTGYGQEGDHARARAAGFDAHLVKPVDAAALLEALHPAA